MDYKAVTQVVTTATQSLFRWEARGIYREPLVPLSPNNTLAVVPVQRVWVVDEPPTQSQYDALARVDRFLDAHEDIRILSETLALDLGLSDQDFWLIDDQYLLLLDYTPAHRLRSGEFFSDSDLVACYRRKRDLALGHANPLTLV